jgi:hypothetical protein
MGEIAAGAILFLGGASSGAAITTGVIVKAALTIASVSYTAFSGYNNYKASKAARKRQLRQERRSSFLNFRDPVPYKRIVFGETRVGGPILFAHSEPQGEVHLFIALASHPVESIDQVYINDEPISLDVSGNATGKYANVVTCHKIDGGGVNEVYDRMVDEGIGPADSGPITVTDEFPGIAGLYVVLRKWSRKFAGDQPEFSAVIKGWNGIMTGNSYDPDGYVFGYSNNPVECARTYMLYFMGINAFSSTRFADCSDAIDYCNELVNLKAGGTEKRYTCNGIVMADQPHEEVLEQLANSFAGAIRYTSGKWSIVVKPVEDGSAIISEDKMLSTYRFDYNRSTRDLPKGIRGTYVDPDRNWQETEFPTLDAPGVLAHQDYLDLELPFTSSLSAAQRISKVFLFRARAEESVKVSMLPSSLRSIPGDVVTFDSTRLGKSISMEVVDTSFTVESDSQGQLRVETTLGLQSYDSTAWDWDPATEEQDLPEGSTNLGGIYAQGPTGLTMVDSVFNLTSSAIRVDIEMDWTNPDYVPGGAALDRTLYEIVIEFTIDPGGGAPHEVVTREKTNVVGVDPGAGGFRPDPIDGSADIVLGAAVNKTVKFIYEWPGSYTYVSYEVITRRIRSIYSNDAKSEWLYAPIPPGEDLTTIAGATLTTIAGVTLTEIE